MGMGFKARASHPRHNQTQVPHPGLSDSVWIEVGLLEVTEKVKVIHVGLWSGSGSRQLHLIPKIAKKAGYRQGTQACLDRFPLNFWWGGKTQNFRSSLVPNRDEVGWGADLQKKSDWSQNCPPNAKLGLFCYFKLEIQLFKVLMILKVVKFDTNMYLNLSNF